MIIKNPFLIKNNEQQEKEEEFLALFDSSVLNMIEVQNLEKASYVSSTPGAGKTSLFRAFSPSVLNVINKNTQNNDYDDIRAQMKRLGVIEGNQVTLLSAMLSCARGYNIIEEMFENGRRKQVLFALLNYRIVIVFVKNLCKLLDYTINDLENVTFKAIPEEMLSEESSFKNVLEAYRWARAGERELCNYLDSSRDNALNLSFVHTTLLSIKLFEGPNILINGESYFKNTVLILDDYHKLTTNQKQLISESIYTLKSKSGVWFGQRLEGLDSLQIVSMDGSLGRDYNPNIIIDKYWSSERAKFYNALRNIADKRVVEARINKFRKFSDCLEESVSLAKYKTRLNECISEIKNLIKSDTGSCVKYSSIVSYIESNFGNDIFKKALYFECIKIRINREKYGQLSLFEEPQKIEDFVKFYETIKDAAEYYICYKCGIPFYYGMEKLQKSSSYNIEQFLFFAADIFDASRVKSLGNAKKIKLTPEEQQRSLKKSSRQKWHDMDYRYKEIDEIKCFINNVVRIAVDSRNSERASYAGGAYTGIGIKSKELKFYANNEKYSHLVDVLGKCLASNYLERRDEIKGDTTVFYLNRWICIYNDLPLAYGGWKPCNMDQLKSMCETDREYYGQQQFDLI